MTWHSTLLLQGAASLPAEKGKQFKGWFKKGTEQQANRAEQDKGPVPGESCPCIQVITHGQVHSELYTDSCLCAKLRVDGICAEQSGMTAGRKRQWAATALCLEV